MNAFRHLPLAALLCACGLVQAATPPRVMFVSGVELQPVIIDPQGKEIPAKKGQVIPPGFSVKVPEGATVQIMTDEKAIVAVRQNSLLKLEQLGDAGQPHKFRLDAGGLRVANPDKNPHKFEVDTPNAKLTFDKGDHEAYFVPESKVKDGKWGTVVRGNKDEAVLRTKDGETRIDRTVVGYVPGLGNGKAELMDRVKSDSSASNPVTNIFRSSPGSFGTELLKNQDQLGANAVAGSRETLPVTRGFTDLAPLMTRGGSGDPQMLLTNTPTRTVPLTAGAIPSGTTPASTSATIMLTRITPPPPIVAKDIYVDPISKTPILLVGDKLSIPTRTLADANLLAPISVSDIPPPTKTTIAPPVVGAPIVTREQQITTISTTLSTRNLKLR